MPLSASLETSLQIHRQGHPGGPFNAFDIDAPGRPNLEAARTELNLPGINAFEVSPSFHGGKLTLELHGIDGEELDPPGPSVSERVVGARGKRFRLTAHADYGDTGTVVVHLTAHPCRALGDCEPRYLATDKPVLTQRLVYDRNLRLRDDSTAPTGGPFKHFADGSIELPMVANDGGPLRVGRRTVSAHLHVESGQGWVRLGAPFETDLPVAKDGVFRGVVQQGLSEAVVSGLVKVPPRSGALRALVQVQGKVATSARASLDITDLVPVRLNAALDHKISFDMPEGGPNISGVLRHHEGLGVDVALMVGDKLTPFHPLEVGHARFELRDATYELLFHGRSVELSRRRYGTCGTSEETWAGTVSGRGPIVVPDNASALADYSARLARGETFPQ